MEEEPEKKEEEEKAKADENIIRKWAFDFNGKIKIIPGFSYMTFHMIFIFCVSFIFAFNTNILHLCILLVVVSLDAGAIVFLHGCPLTLLERKYLGTDDCEFRRQTIQKMGIMYKCDHEYEKQIEVMINTWSLIACKILFLILFKTFQLKLQNYDNLYV